MGTELMYEAVKINYLLSATVYYLMVVVTCPDKNRKLERYENTINIENWLNDTGLNKVITLQHEAKQ